MISFLKNKTNLNPSSKASSLRCIARYNVSITSRLSLPLKDKKSHEYNKNVRPHVARCLPDKLSKAQKPLITLNSESSLLQS